jgi:WD40 repeat protein
MKFLHFILLLAIATGCRTRGNMPAKYEVVGDPVFRADVSNLNAHSSTITKMRLTADGRYLYTISFDKSVKVWDVKTGQVIRTLFFENWWSSEGFSICLLPNNTIAVQYGGHVEIWSALLEKKLSAFFCDQRENDNRSIVDMHATRDGSKLVLMFGDGVVIWDTKTQKNIFELSGLAPNARVMGSQIIQDSRLYIYADFSIVEVDLTTFRHSILRSFSKREFGNDEFPSVSFSRDGRYLVSFVKEGTSYTCSGYLFDLIAKTKTPLATHDEFVHVSEFDSDNKTFFTTSYSGLKRFDIDATNGTAQVKILGEHNFCAAVDVSGELIAAGTPDYQTNVLNFYDWNTNALLSSIPRMATNAMTFQLNEDGTEITGEDFGDVMLMKVENGQSYMRGIYQMTLWSPMVDGDFLAAVCSNHLSDPKQKVVVVDKSAGLPQTIFEQGLGEKDKVWSLDLNSKKGLLAVKYQDSIIVYDFKHRKVVETFPDVTHYISKVKFSPSGNLLVAGNRIYSFPKKRWIATLEAEEGFAGTMGVTFSKDERQVAVAKTPYFVYSVFNIETNTLVRKFTSPMQEELKGDIFQIVLRFTDDGRFFGVGESNKIVKVWDVTSGVLVATQNGNFCDREYVPAKFDKYEIMKYQNGFCFKAIP